MRRRGAARRRRPARDCKLRSLARAPPARSGRLHANQVPVSTQSVAASTQISHSKHAICHSSTQSVTASTQISCSRHATSRSSTQSVAIKLQPVAISGCRPRHAPARSGRRRGGRPRRRWPRAAAAPRAPPRGARTTRRRGAPACERSARRSQLWKGGGGARRCHQKQSWAISHRRVRQCRGEEERPALRRVFAPRAVDRLQRRDARRQGSVRRGGQGRVREGRTRKDEGGGQGRMDAGVTKEDGGEGSPAAAPRRRPRRQSP